MRKFFSLLVVLLVIGISSSVFADAAPPRLIDSAKGVIVNPNGTKVYEDIKDFKVKDELKNGDKVTMWWRGSSDEEYMPVEYGDDYQYGWVLTKDVQKLEWQFSDLTFNNTYKEQRTVLNPNGVDIHEWLSDDSKVIGNIPYNTTIQYQFSNQDYTWGYVTYNGVTGWIDTLSDDIGYELKGRLMTTWRGATLRDAQGSALIEVPANTVFDKFYHAYDQMSGSKYYVTYKGVSGYIPYYIWDENSVVATSSKNYYTVDYEGAILIGTDNSIIPVPYGTFLEYEISADDQIFTSYNHKEGWVFKLPYYYDEESKQRSIDEVNEWMTNATQFIQDRKQNPTISAENPEEQNNEIVRIPQTTTQSDKTEAESNDNTEKEISFPLQQMIFICVLCAVIASLTTAVIVMLVNRKKQK